MYENGIMKPVKIVFKRGKGMIRVIGGGEFDQSTLCAGMEISQ
jgi:predicted DNA-binding antitoxin AbrB/MazE fold protein